MPRQHPVSVSHCVLCKAYLFITNLHDGNTWAGFNTLFNKNTKVPTLKNITIECGMKTGLLNIIRDRHSWRKISGKIIKARGSSFLFFKSSTIWYLWAKAKEMEMLCYVKKRILYFSINNFWSITCSRSLPMKGGGLTAAPRGTFPGLRDCSPGLRGQHTQYARTLCLCMSLQVQSPCRTLPSARER